VTEHVPIVISGPATPETLRVLRGVAASVGARADQPFDHVEELRIAVDEAATMLLAAGVADTITLTIDPSDPGRLYVRVRSDGAVAGWPGDRARSWGWRVIAELAGDAAMTSDDGGRPEVSFTWVLEAAAGDGRGTGG